MITKAQILAAFPALTSATRDDGVIAAALSVGRTKLVSTTSGVGTILAALGPAAGAALLDSLAALAPTNSPLKYGLQMINAGTLNLGDPTTQGMLTSLGAAGVMTVADAAILNALAVVSDPVTAQQVSKALEGWAA